MSGPPKENGCYLLFMRDGRKIVGDVRIEISAASGGAGGGAAGTSGAGANGTGANGLRANGSGANGEGDSRGGRGVMRLEVHVPASRGHAGYLAILAPDSVQRCVRCEHDEAKLIAAALRRDLPATVPTYEMTSLAGPLPQF
jgi:hypothetical protein